MKFVFFGYAVKRKIFNLFSLVILSLAFSACEDQNFYKQDYLSANDNAENNNTDDNDPNDSSTQQYEEKIDSFFQVASRKKLDILWVIDNSGSMGDDQTTLANSFSDFISSFLLEDVDFQMGITTTDPTNKTTGDGRSIQKNGKDSFELLTREKAREDQAEFINSFKSMAKVGTSGSGLEQGLNGARRFFERYQNEFMRDNSYTVIVFVTDEEDASHLTQAQYNGSGSTAQPNPHPVSEYIDFFKGIKDGSLDYIKAYSIVGYYEGGCDVSYRNGASFKGCVRYKEFSDATNGIVRSIQNNFSESLLDMAEEIVDLSQSFPLSERPEFPDEIKVYVNSINVTEHWAYKESSNTIIFDDNNLPSEGSEVKVSYKIKK